jgi:PAS domain S-box-containing protein
LSTPPPPLPRSPLAASLAATPAAGAGSDEMFRLLVASVRDYAIFMLDPSGHVATWNLGAERIKGYLATEIIGRHFSVFYPEDDVVAGKCELELEVAARDGRFEDENWRIRSDGSRFWANVVITAIRDAAGALVGFAKVTRDLTERKRSEDERAARLAAEQANRTKDEFLATLSHELRNPLAPIVTALQLIKLHGEGRATREYQVIERQVQHLVHLVDDLLDVSRVSGGKLELKRRVVDVRDALARAVEMASPLVEHKAHHFEVDAPSHALLVDGDPLRLTQIFENLLTNAAKYTDPGGHLGVVVRDADGWAIIVVRDDGIGIDRELLPRVFDLFVQASQSSDRARGGLGLGLPLVRSLVHAHGGEVELHSRGTNLGTTVTVRLPLVDRLRSTEPGHELLAAGSALPAGRRILVVDDNEDARLLMAEMLQALGHDVRSAGDGPQALALLADFVPELAILDIGLPGMDGYELAARLRERVPAAIHLVAVSGYGQPADQARGVAAGFDRHLVKPVDVRRLIETLASFTR